MKPLLRTNRLLLRQLEFRDAETMFAYRSDPIVSRYQTWNPPDIPSIKAFIQEQQNVIPDTTDTWMQFAITILDNDQMIGDCGIHFPESGNTVDLGITLDTAHQGKGYALETFECLIAYAFNELSKDRVIGIADSRNKASIKMMKRAGLVELVEKKETVYLKGEWLDEIYFELKKEFWKNQKV